MSSTVRPQQLARQAHDTPARRPQIVRERLRDVIILRPLGTLDRSVMERLRTIILESDDPVVVDLDDCVLVDPRRLMQIGRSPRSGDPEMRIVCRRLSCRRLLARVGITDRFPVFDRLEDALATPGRRVPT